jgi:hypothetical protein
MLPEKKNRRRLSGASGGFWYFRSRWADQLKLFPITSSVASATATAEEGHGKSDPKECQGTGFRDAGH